jgi:DNA-binding HxlR family transcriptional regulator
MARPTYGLLCPIAHASDLLGPRWTMPILSELWAGSTRFNDIKRGVGNISSGLLAKRLKELEAAGLVERVEDKGAGTVDYVRTEKAIRLEPALNALAEWAQCNIDADIALRDTDVSALMWTVRRKIDILEMPRRRVVIRFQFRSEDGLQSRVYWLVVDPESALPELCSTDPGMDVNMFVEADTLAMASVMTGRTTIDREIHLGRLYLTGDQLLVRTIHRWLKLSAYAGLDGIAMFPASSVHKKSSVA